MGKRRDVVLITAIIDGKEQTVKKCTICNKLVPLDGFHKSEKGLGGRASRCKDCSRKYAKKYNKTNRTVNKIHIKDGLKYKQCNVCNEDKPLSEFYRHGKSYVAQCKVCYSRMRQKGTRLKPINVVMVNGIPSKECRSCGVLKPLDEYYTSWNGRGVGGKRAKCKECERKIWKETRKYRREILIERTRKWRLANPEKQRQSQRRWRKNNKEKDRVYQNRRKARQRELRNDLTNEQWEEVLEFFDRKCALTKQSEDIEMDHFIPISTGHGGTYKGNVVPLSSAINNSKHNRNPFEWYEEYGKQHGIKHDDWLNLIRYLANENGMSLEEYEDYVNSCFRGD